VASFYLDHDLNRQVKAALEALGHQVIRTRDLQLERADDATQLLTAARRGAMLVTHNERDYTLLHRAWRLWPAPLAHAGVLVIPQQRWSPAEAARQIDGFVRSGQPLPNDLYRWTPARGWQRFG
jgi:hypothetical protein